MNNTDFFKIIRRPVVLAKRGSSKSKLYNDVKNGVFVPPIPIGARAVGWVESECDKVIQAMIAGYSEQQLKDLVQDIVANRTVKL